MFVKCLGIFSRETFILYVNLITKFSHLNSTFQRLDIRRFYLLSRGVHIYLEVCAWRLTLKENGKIFIFLYISVYWNIKLILIASAEIYFLELLLTINTNSVSVPMCKAQARIAYVVNANALSCAVTWNRKFFSTTLFIWILWKIKFHYNSA